jgi:hypothetical protein
MRPLLAAALLLPPSLHASVAGFTPAEGWSAGPLQLRGDVAAIALDGRFAVGSSSASGAVVTIYNHSRPEGRVALGEVAAPGLRYLGGIAFDGNDLLISENGARDTVYRANTADGTLTALAPEGSMPNVGEVGVRPGGGILAVAANSPGRGRLYHVAGGAASIYADGLGTGYLGGLSFDGDAALVADTNDPNFTGAAGRVLRLDGAGAVAGALDLAGGGGSGVYDIAWSGGTLFATTGTTLTRWHAGVATPFGAFGGAFPFPTDILADPDGSVIVNGIYTDAGGFFRLTPTGVPVPEPGTLLLVAIGFLPLLRGRRQGR